MYQCNNCHGYVKRGTLRAVGTHWYTMNVSQNFMNAFPDCCIPIIIIAGKDEPYLLTYFKLCLY